MEVDNGEEVVNTYTFAAVTTDFLSFQKPSHALIEIQS